MSDEWLYIDKQEWNNSEILKQIKDWGLNIEQDDGENTNASKNIRDASLRDLPFKSLSIERDFLPHSASLTNIVWRYLETALQN